MTAPIDTMPGVHEVRDLRSRVHRRLAEGHEAGDFEGPEGRTRLRAALTLLLRDEAPLITTDRLEGLVDDLVHEVVGLGPLEPLLADPDVSEVMVNGPGRVVVERSGSLVPVPLDLDAHAIVRLVQRAVTPLGLRCDRTAPIVDARLADGSRLHAVLPPLAVDGPYVTIRRFEVRPMGVDAFAADAAVVDLLDWAVVAGWNLIVSGATSSGKTTLLNALSACVAADERIVTIEETAELRLQQPHVVRLEARPANAEGVGAVGLRDLVRAALRMRPDRLVVGEVRGAEAFDMLEALNTGHDGSLSTIHANGPLEALIRLEALSLRGASGLPVEAVRAHIAASVDAVIHVGRSSDGSRHVQSLCEVGTTSTASLAVTPLYQVHDGVVSAPSRAVRRGDAPGWGQAC